MTNANATHITITITSTTAVTITNTNATMYCRHYLLTITARRLSAVSTRATPVTTGEVPTDVKLLKLCFPGA